MKAMILAAGLGVRMRPLTLRHAKAALPVLNRPLVHWTLDHLARHGVDEVVINVHHLPSTVTRAAGDGRAFGLRVTYSRERTILGTGGGPRKVRRFFGDEPFFLVNGDMVFDFDLRRLIARHRRAGALATVSLQRFPDRGTYRAVVTDARGRLRSFGGHPSPARGRAWHFTGVQVIDPGILDRLPSGYAETARDLYGPLIAEGARLLGVPLEGRWYDLSSPRLYLVSQMELLDQGFAGARSGPCIDPSARIDRGALVQHAVIGARCVVGRRAVVRNSVLWQGVSVGEGARVDTSIVTDRVRVPAGAKLRSMIVMPRRQTRLPR